MIHFIDKNWILSSLICFWFFFTVAKNNWSKKHRSHEERILNTIDDFLQSIMAATFVFMVLTVGWHVWKLFL